MKAASYALTGTVTFDGKGQAELVHRILKDGPATAAAVAERLEKMPEFKTRQTSLRIAAYYICVFKKAGIAAPVADVPTVTDAVNEHEDETFEIE